MKRFMCKSKIHRATVTGTDRDYEGSISVCPGLLDEAGILPFEKVHVWNVTNGKRFVTYAIRGDAGCVCVNGSAALLCDAGDIVIIASFGVYDEPELREFRQRVVFVDENNCVK
ncbi:MAG: aspartate 1-decarboxylase [Candidatus Nanohalarchaeota archaeon]|nr:MAG: aspartate 1-decarboxylase [Candidatus Nanohaloarchaeota archaeon]